MKLKPSEKEENIESACTVAASVKDVSGCLGKGMIVTLQSGYYSYFVSIEEIWKHFVCLSRHKQTPAPTRLQFSLFKNQKGPQTAIKCCKLGKIFLKELVCKFFEK